MGEALYNLSKYELKHFIFENILYLIQLSLKTLHRRPAVQILQLKKWKFRKLKLPKFSHLRYEIKINLTAQLMFFIKSRLTFMSVYYKKVTMLNILIQS